MPERTWVPVTVPVEAKIGDVHLRLFPFESSFQVPDQPWCWGAMCRITFRFGRLVTSKRITQRYAYLTKLGWAQEERPSDAALAEGRETVLANLRSTVEAHGVKVENFVIKEEAS